MTDKEKKTADVVRGVALGSLPAGGCPNGLPQQSDNSQNKSGTVRGDGRTS